jgi:hypothetical protein
MRRVLDVGLVIPVACVAAIVAIVLGSDRTLAFLLVLSSGLALAAALVWFSALSRFAPGLEVMFAINAVAKEYWRTTVGSERRPRYRREAREWLAANPETDGNRCIRIGLLLWLGRLDEVRASVARQPADEPIDRFDRVYFEALLAWMEGQPVDVDTLHDHARKIDPDHADSVAFAMADIESRLAIVAGRDIWRPYIEARPKLVRLPAGADRRTIATRAALTVMVATTILALALAILVQPA